MMPLIAMLRAATADIHRSLEQSGISRTIMSPQVNLADYSAYLKKLFTIHSAVEEAVFPVVTTLIGDCSARKKTHLLAQDLAALQQPLPQNGPAFLDAGFRSNPLFCLGMVYVTEGSTLGGLYILKNLQTVLGPQVNGCTAFFNVYGPHTGSSWRNFMASLEQCETLLTQQDKEEVVAGAVYGFERTGNVLNQAAL